MEIRWRGRKPDRLMRDMVWTGKHWVRWDDVTDEDRADARAFAKAMGLRSQL